MTPGPTSVAENVRLARSMECSNPDIDPEFYLEYKETCERFSTLMNTKNETLILSGEGILGLEAACASLTEPEDRVLVLDNGVFGKGFADFVKIYGGDPILYSVDYEKPIDPAALEEFLKKDSDFKYATVVHCDTPSGMCNDISVICPLLKRYGILTVVDAVASMFGEYVDVDQFQIDLLCGGSQKAISAPPGLTLVTLSKDAKEMMEKRKTPIASFYANLLMFKGYFEAQWFPYTMPISDIKGLRQALDNIAGEADIVERHQKIAKAVRTAIKKSGLQLYQETGFCGTVTAFRVPRETTGEAILDRMGKKHGILLAGSFDVFKGKLIRIGHMGENCRIEKLRHVMMALDDTFRELGVNTSSSLAQEFDRTL